MHKYQIFTHKHLLKYYFFNQSSKLTAIRKAMTESGLDTYLVPHNDAHDSEHIADVDERLAFITGFTGSAGIALITQNRALLWTDSRYWLQAEQQLESGWELIKLDKNSVMWFDFVKEIEAKNVGFDPMLLNAKTYKLRSEQLQEVNIELKFEETNLVDKVWSQKSKETIRKIFIHDDTYTGRSVQSNLKSVFEIVTKNKATSTLISNLAQIAWVLNLRGQDVEFNPVFYSYLFLETDGQKVSGILYINKEKLDQSVLDHLKNNEISVKPYEQVFNDLSKLNTFVLLNNEEINQRLFQTIPQDKIVSVTIHPIENLKAVKNQREVQGFRDCHVRDGAALVRYLSWLEKTVVSGDKLDEYEAAEKLESFRNQVKLNKGLSFASISSSGSNAAVIHYKPEKGKCKAVIRSDIYLIDSGGQYLDGTTDVTRTLHFGTPSQAECDANTRVLMGNLDIDRLVFPANSNINGSDIDILARRWLWEAGLNYGHGTGHGVGYFLNVHEGPCRISKQPSANFVPGMVVSNEPGYYKDGQYGMRIENLLVVVEKEEGFLGFENLTLCPYDRKLINVKLMTKTHIEQVNQYHQRVLQVLIPELIAYGDTEALKWLQYNCEPLMV